MKNFNVHLLRRVNEGATIKVKAKSQKDAEAKAAEYIENGSDDLYDELGMDVPDWDITTMDEPEVVPLDSMIVKDRTNQSNREKSSELIEYAVQEFMSIAGTDKEDVLCDMLCDLMHWASVNKMDFERELNRATIHFVKDAAEDLERKKPRRKK